MKSNGKLKFGSMQSEQNMAQWFWTYKVYDREQFI